MIKYIVCFLLTREKWLFSEWLSGFALHYYTLILLYLVSCLLTRDTCSSCVQKCFLLSFISSCRKTFSVLMCITPKEESMNYE